MVELPSPTKVYHTPGAEFKEVTQVATASAVAVVVDALIVCPHAIGNAPVQRSLAGGGGGAQLVHCTVVVRQVLCVPQAALVAQCAKMFPVNVFANTRGVTPDAITGPFEVPECIVIKSVATLLVKLRVCPFTAPEIAENSPAKEQVEIVTTVPDVFIGTVADGNWEPNVH